MRGTFIDTGETEVNVIGKVPARQGVKFQLGCRQQTTHLDKLEFLMELSAIEKALWVMSQVCRRGAALPWAQN